MGKLTDETGNSYGRLIVLKKAGAAFNTSGHHKGMTWLCMCACGTPCNVLGRYLREGFTKSCGCLRKGPNSWQKRRGLREFDLL
jgi:hypothetical protein